MKEDKSIEVPERLIDIEALFASKNPKLGKLIPGFILSYLKRITHQDEINGYIWRNRDKTGLPFVDAILREFGVRVEVTDARKIQEPLSANPAPGSHPPDPSGNSASLDPLIPHSPTLAGPLIPPTGRFIVAANHPLGGLDGMALMHALGQIRQDIVFPVNDLLMNVPGLRPLFIPINKHGRNTENARLIDETFASEKMVLYFPAGLVSRKSSVIRDLEWKNTFIKKARKYRRDIIPVYINGRNSDWFYNLSNWRKRLGIKTNIEMLYLVDEMVQQLGKTITCAVGDIIPYTVFDKSKTDAQWAEWVKEKVYEMEMKNKKSHGNKID